MDIGDMKSRLRDGEDPLELSIEKWQDVVTGRGKCYGEVNCALCEKFNNWKVDKNCEGCPVFRTTGKQYCEGTPYDEYSPSTPNKKLNKLAKEELAFLIGLRPLWAKMKHNSLHSTKKEN